MLRCLGRVLALQKFLASRIPPLEVTVDQLFKWDKDFPLNSVPVVEESSLPVPPAQGDGCWSRLAFVYCLLALATDRYVKSRLCFGVFG